MKQEVNFIPCPFNQPTPSFMFDHSLRTQDFIVVLFKQRHSEKTGFFNFFVLCSSSSSLIWFKD